MGSQVAVHIWDPKGLQQVQVSPPPFFTLTILSDVYKSRSSVSGNIPNSSFTSFLFGPDIFLSIIFVKILYKLHYYSKISHSVLFPRKTRIPRSSVCFHIMKRPKNPTRS